MSFYGLFLYEGLEEKPSASKHTGVLNISSLSPGDILISPWGAEVTVVSRHRNGRAVRIEHGLNRTEFYKDDQFNVLFSGWRIKR